MGDQGASAGRLRPQRVLWVSQAKNPTHGKGDCCPPIHCY